MDDEMTDIEKIKIDILRDALKDASDTVRALDRKIVFLVSYNAIFLGAIVTIFFKYDELSKLNNNLEFFYSCLAVIGFIWILIFISIMMGISPKSNPIEVLKISEEQEFANNIFFIFTDGKKESLELNNIIESYDKINNYKQIEKLLYKEISKVSYIRDLKLKSVKKSVTSSWIFTFIFVIFTAGFGFHTFLNKKSELNNSSIQKDYVNKIVKYHDTNVTKKDSNAS